MGLPSPWEGQLLKAVGEGGETMFALSILNTSSPTQIWLPPALTSPKGR